MLNSYLDDVIVSRRLMNNMINLMSHQERNIRAVYVNQHNNRNNYSNQYSYFVNDVDRHNQRSNVAPISQPTRTNNTRQQRTISRQRGAGIQPSTDATFQFNNMFTPTHGVGRNRRPVIPTALEINTATITTTFSNLENPQNTTCPITRESFNADDNVTQIIQCGHTFNTNNLYEWFNHNSVCPMCRYNIRTNSDVTPTTSTTTSTNNTNNDQDNELNENRIPDLTNIAEQIASDILTNITDSPTISLEYSLYTPRVNNSTTTHRTSIDPSLNL